MILFLQDGDKNCTVTNLSSGFNKQMDIKKETDTVKKEVKSSTSTKTIGVKLDVGTIKCNEKFQCKASDLYEALTRSEMVTAFTRAYVKLDAAKGGEYVYSKMIIISTHFLI